MLLLGAYVIHKHVRTLIFRWFTFPPARTLLFSTCTIIENYIHIYYADMAKIQAARLLGLHLHVYWAHKSTY